jgi:hypothetical protein
MTFDYKNSFNQDIDKWEQFDNFLSDLSETYPNEFEKEIYKHRKFMTIGYKSNLPDICYAFDSGVSEDIQKQILAKLKQLFP